VLWLLLTSLAWADPVIIEAEGPGVVRVRASQSPVFIPACAGVGWERFDEKAGLFVAVPTVPCGPLEPAIQVGPEGVQATMSVPLGAGEMHVVRAVVLIARKCTENTPFPLAGCTGLSHHFGPNQVVRSK
jgi:hypothetical protein